MESSPAASKKDKASHKGIVKRQTAKMKVLFFRLTGSVIRKIWPQVILNAIYSTVIVCFHNYVYGMQITFPHTLIAVLGPVTGLLLVFRTNTAYDRYWEGRKLWSHMSTTIRVLTRYVWVLVEENNPEDLVEKTSALNLLVAFPFAVKNYLRGEHSYDKDNIKDLITHLPHFTCPVVPDQMMKSQSEQSVTSNNIEIWLKIPGLDSRRVSSRRSIWNIDSERENEVITNIPMELTYYFTQYLAKISPNIPAPFMNSMNASLITLTDCISGLERVLNTPIPVAYAVHLEHAVWIYLLSLPYQLIKDINWWTIPAVTLASFALLGILGIGDEIENPFGYDYNDLPLGEYCDQIQREVYVMSGRCMGSTNTDSWVKSNENQPFTPTAFTNANDLCKMTMEDVQQLLAQRAQQFKLH